MEERYYHTQESVAEYIQSAKGYNGNDLIEKLKKVLPAKSKLLELGSGPGSDWEILDKHYAVNGSDSSAVFISHLTGKYPNETFLQLNAATLDIDQSFDGIYSNKVLHHLTDSELTHSIKRQHEMLNANGVVCHSFWKGEGSEVFKGMYVNYHTQESLRESFREQFDILVLECYAEFEDGDSVLLIGKKK
jgi:trans-aconitate methyltransferase